MQKVIKIRAAAESDIAAIHEITQEAFAKYAYDLGEGLVVKALAETREDVAAELKAKHILVGELDGAALGSIRYEFVNNIAYFSRFGVKLVAQNCGMGRALVQAVVAAARENGCRAVAPHTSAQMASLIRFYYGQGFFIHSVNTSPGYYRALLVKPLSPDAGCFDYASLVAGK